MDIGKTFTNVKDRRAILSTIWIFAMLNYLYCDVMSLMDADFLKQYMTGNVGGVAMTPGFFLAAAALMEIPTALVLVSRVAGYKVNRWANITAGIIMTVVQFSTLFLGSPPTVYYIFFSVVEIASTLVIIWYAWTWPSPQS